MYISLKLVLYLLIQHYEKIEIEDVEEHISNNTIYKWLKILGMKLYSDYTYKKGVNVFSGVILASFLRLWRHSGFLMYIRFLVQSFRFCQKYLYKQDLIIHESQFAQRCYKAFGNLY